jgi:hypothetical protein
MSLDNQLAAPYARAQICNPCNIEPLSALHQQIDRLLSQGTWVAHGGLCFGHASLSCTGTCFLQVALGRKQ